MMWSLKVSTSCKPCNEHTQTIKMMAYTFICMISKYFFFKCNTEQAIQVILNWAEQLTSRALVRGNFWQSDNFSNAPRRKNSPIRKLKSIEKEETEAPIYSHHFIKWIFSNINKLLSQSTNVTWLLVFDIHPVLLNSFPAMISFFAIHLLLKKARNEKVSNGQSTNMNMPSCNN